MAEGEDEIIFIGEYKDFKLGVHFSMGESNDQDAAYALGYISERIGEAAYRFSGINIARIKLFAKPEGEGLKAVVSFLEKNPQSKIKEALLEGIEDKLLLPAAESFFFNQLLKNAKVDFKVSGNLIDSTIVPEEEAPEDMVAFIGNYKGWMAIKKLGLEDVKDYEVSAILAGINNTIVNKAFGFSGCNKNDEEVAKIASGRKSFGNLLTALGKLITEHPKLGTERRSIGNRLDDAYLLCKVFEKLGYKPYASPEMLSNAHPDIKPPKVKGRKPK
jgi:hypothetical protein